MANTYTQIYNQFVFSVKGRDNFIKETFRDELEKTICGIISFCKCKPLAIYCNPDHVHILIGMNPTISPSKLMEQVKSGSSNWLNEKIIISGKFHWQDGYGCFSYSRSQIDYVIKYILNQPKHHKKQTFKEEYLLILQKFDVDYNDRYLFEYYDS